MLHPGVSCGVESSDMLRRVYESSLVSLPLNMDTVNNHHSIIRPSKLKLPTFPRDLLVHCYFLLEQKLLGQIVIRLETGK